MEDCEWCEGKKNCPSFQPTKGVRPGFVCTRGDGHKGNHVVCLPFRHKVAEWPALPVKAEES